jgi:hypothetical protein
MKIGDMGEVGTVAKNEPIHGATWHGTVDGLLDLLSVREKARARAAVALATLQLEHPELRDDRNLITARRELL